MNPFNPPERPTDELLSAWLDGELAGPEQQAQRAAVEAWLHEHPDDAARVRLWAADAEALRMRLALLLDEPVPDALRAVVLRRPVLPTRWALAASAAGLLLLGGLIGGTGVWQWQQRAGPDGRGPRAGGSGCNAPRPPTPSTCPSRAMRSRSRPRRSTWRAG